jgi:hypothetical protein
VPPNFFRYTSVMTDLSAMHKSLVDAERAAFSERLKDMLVTVGITNSATVLCREFNVRNPTQPVTYHAVRKWLIGECIPIQARLEGLAEMLGTTANWLRFGDGNVEEKWVDLGEGISTDFILMYQDAKRLDPASRVLLDTFIEIMLKVQTASQEEGHA